MIIYTNANPVLSAQDLCDSDILTKTEFAFHILLTVLKDAGCPEHRLPNTRPKHYRLNTISFNWAKRTRNNFIWTLEWGLALCREFKLRFGKSHPLEPHYIEIDANSLRRYVKRGKLSVPPKDFNEEFLTQEMKKDMVGWSGEEANRRYYMLIEPHFVMKWNCGREKPDWWTV